LTAAAEVDEAGRPGVGQERLLFQAELDDEVPELRRRTDRVGSHLEEISIPPFGADDAAGTVGLVEDGDVLALSKKDRAADKAGEPASDDDRAHDQNSLSARTRFSRAARKVGESFRPGVRRKCGMPARRASSPNNWSIS